MSVSDFEEEQREKELKFLREMNISAQEKFKQEQAEKAEKKEAEKKAAALLKAQSYGGYLWKKTDTPKPVDYRASALSQLTPAQLAEIQQGTATFNEISSGGFEYVPLKLTDSQIEARIIDSLPENIKSEVLAGDLKLRKDRAEFDERAEPGTYDIKLTGQGFKRYQREDAFQKEYGQGRSYQEILERAAQLIPQYEQYKPDSEMITREAPSGYEVSALKEAVDGFTLSEKLFRQKQEVWSPIIQKEYDPDLKGVDKLQAELIKHGIRYDERIDKMQSSGLAHLLQRQLNRREIILPPSLQAVLNVRLAKERMKLGFAKGSLKLFNVPLTGAGLIVGGKALGRIGEATGKDILQKTQSSKTGISFYEKDRKKVYYNQKKNTQAEINALRNSGVVALALMREDQQEKFAKDPYSASGEIVGSILTYAIPATAAAKASASAARAAAIAGRATAKGTKLANKSRIIKRSGQAFEAIIEPGETILTFAGKKIAPKTVMKLGGSLGPEELLIHGTVKTGAMLEKISVGSLNRVRRSVRASELRRGKETTFEAAPGTSSTDIHNTWHGTIERTADKPPKPVEITKWIDDLDFKSLEPAGVEVGTVGAMEAGDIFRRKIPITIKQDVPFPTTSAGKTPYTEELQPYFGGPTETTTGVGYVGDIKITKDGKSKIVSARKAQRIETDQNIAKMLNEARAERIAARKSRPSTDYMFGAVDPVTPFVRSSYKMFSETDFPGIYKAEVKIRKAGKAKTKPFPRTEFKTRSDFDLDALSKMSSIEESISAKLSKIESDTLSKLGSSARVRVRTRARPEMDLRIRTRGRVRGRVRGRTRVRARARVRTQVRVKTQAVAKSRVRVRARARARTRVRAKWTKEKGEKNIRDLWGGGGEVIRKEFEFGLAKDLNAQAKVRKEAMKDLSKMRGK